MKPSAIPGWLVLAAVLGVGPAAAEDFSRTLRPDEFAAAGLGKLSPDELARLDALVRAYRPAAPAAESSSTAGAAGKRGTAVSSARGAPPAGTGVVRVQPGTTIEYDEVESRLTGRFNGWELRMIFTLENGQRWQVLDTAPYSGRSMMSPKVKVAPGALGSFWMTIEGAARPVKVKRLAPVAEPGPGRTGQP